MSTSSTLQSAPHNRADDTCQQPSAAGVDQSRLDFLLRHLVRCSEVFQAGLAMLKPDHFVLPDEEVYEAAWAAAVDCYRRDDWPPVEVALRWAMVDRLAKERGDRLWFGQDSRIAQLISTVLDDGDDEPTFNVELALAVLIPTGVAMLDDRMNGGSESGDVNVILAPPDTGQTALGVQIVVSAARLASQPAAADAHKGKLQVHFSTGRRRRSLQILAAANAARVKRARLSQIKDDSVLSTTANPLDYDHEVTREFECSDGRVLGETERIEAVRPWMDRLVRFVDVEKLPAKINGKDEHVWVHRIRHALDRLRSENGQEIGHVVIDSAWDVLLQEPWDETQDGLDAMHREMSSFVSLVRQNIAEPLGCVVWVIHKLVPGSRVVPAAVLPLDRFADHCSTFSWTASYTFVLGNRDQNNGTRLLHCTRRPEGRCSRVTICKFNSDFAEFVPADEEYALVEEQKQIVLRSGRRNRSVRPWS